MTGEPPGVGPVPLLASGPARTAAGGAPGTLVTDFGRQVHGRPAVVYRPRTSSGLVAAVAEAEADGHVVVPRGRGHSVDGQTVADGAALLDTSALRSVLDVSPTSITVEAGATWRDVLATTVPTGRAPAVVPDFLDLTVGGTLAMGGISGISHTLGTAADHVRGGTVVGPDGARVELEAGDERLGRVLTGQGAHGVLLDVTLALREVPAVVRRADIVTSRLEDHVDVQCNLLGTAAVHWLEGAAAPGADGRMTYVTRLAQPDDPHGSGLLMDRTRGRSDFARFTARADVAVQAEQASGRWQLAPHPRLQTIVPLAPGVGVVGDLLAATPPDLLGPGGRVLVHATAAGALARLGVRGDATGHALVVGWQRTAPRGDAGVLRRMQAANRRIANAVLAVGGVLYGAGKLPAG